jgi:hypothetical protein
MYTKQNIKINTDTEEVFNLVMKKLKSKEPLSIIRIGDGEIAVLLTDPNHKGCAHFYNTHLGRVPNIQEMKEISQNLKTAINDCDILGIPTEKIERGSNPYWSISREMLSNILNEKDKTNNKKFCSMNVHYDLVTLKKLDSILKEINEVYLVTSRDVESRIQKKYPNIKKFNSYKIPGEYKYEDSKKIEEYYPTIYKKIESDFKNKNMSGKLLLIGGGFVGKNLAVTFSKSGGVSIDIGSIFDQFVGKITRGVGKGPNKYGKSLI